MPTNPTDPDDMVKCSTCDRPATHEVVDADPSKGNLCCFTCRGYWPLHNFRKLGS